MRPLLVLGLAVGLVAVAAAPSHASTTLTGISIITVQTPGQFFSPYSSWSTATGLPPGNVTASSPLAISLTQGGAAVGSAPVLALGTDTFFYSDSGTSGQHGTGTVPTSVDISFSFDGNTFGSGFPAANLADFTTSGGPGTTIATGSAPLGGQALPGQYFIDGPLTVSVASSTFDTSAQSGEVIFNVTATVPEPASFALIATGIFGLGLIRRRRVLGSFT